MSGTGIEDGSVTRQRPTKVLSTCTNVGTWLINVFTDIFTHNSFASFFVPLLPKAHCFIVPGYCKV